ncbi:hypothetical protein PF008_g22106 [Phytophthora fragariae]|uniref:Uncharacterized protein n=1 Tax=Phytophthora fragariae TaxID=53985 RepID=A0A6G0QVR6_9STRA|nr:hypothetical protein PF008_g22106 [Phytophthora fragariae]
MSESCPMRPTGIASLICSKGFPVTYATPSVSLDGTK